MKVEKFTSLSMSSDCSTTYCGDAHAPLKMSTQGVYIGSELECSEEGYTSSVWLENKSIFIELPKVSEITTNHWFFLRCDWSPDSIWIYYQS